MQEQDSVPAGAILENWSKDPWTNGVQVDRMEDMEKLVIQTRNSLYEIIIIDGRSGEILVREFTQASGWRLTPTASGL